MFSLLNPYLLIGLVAVGIPIAIHIISRHRAKTVPFSSIVFLEESVRERVGIKRIQDILTLVLRCLLILLLVLAAAKPLLKRSKGSFVGTGSEASVVIVLDNSCSMGYREGEMTRFDRGKALAATIMGTLEQNDRAILLTTADKGGRHISWEEAGVVEARKSLAAAELSASGQSFLFALAAALDFIKDAAGGIREIHVISDFQETAFSSPEVIQKIKASKTHASVYAISVAQARGQNSAIEEVSLLEAFPLVGRPLTITARLRNYGDKPTLETVLLAADGTRRASREIKLEPGESQAVHFHQVFEQPGRHEISISLQDEDPLPSDNRRFLPALIHQAMPILVVDGGDLRLGPMAETFYLKAALAPVTGGTAFPLKPMVVMAQTLQDEKFDAFPIILLANVPELEARTLSRLESAVERGANLGIFLGERIFTDASLYGESPLFPLQLGEIRMSPSGLEKDFAIQVIEFAHPVVHRFRRGEAGDLSQVQIRQYWQLGKKEKSPVTILAKFASGDPALVEAAHGRGKILIFASKCDADWSDFPRRATYLPFIQQMIDYFGPTRDKGREFLVGQVVPFVFEFRDTAVPIAIQAVDKTTVRLVASGKDRAETLFEKTDLPGCYLVDIHRPDGLKEDLLAVNVDPRESNLSIADRKVLTDLVPGRTTLVSAEEDLKSLLKRNREGIELWGNLLVFVLFLAVAECYMANRSTPVG